MTIVGQCCRSGWTKVGFRLERFIQTFAHLALRALTKRPLKGCAVAFHAKKLDDCCFREMSSGVCFYNRCKNTIIMIRASEGFDLTEDVCQAGHMLGALGDRSSLARELFRLADELPNLHLY